MGNGQMVKWANEQINKLAMDNWAYGQNKQVSKWANDQINKWTN